MVRSASAWWRGSGRQKVSTDLARGLEELLEVQVGFPFWQYLEKAKVSHCTDKGWPALEEGGVSAAKRKGLEETKAALLTAQAVIRGI